MITLRTLYLDYEKNIGILYSSGSVLPECFLITVSNRARNGEQCLRTQLHLTKILEYARSKLSSPIEEASTRSVEISMRSEDREIFLRFPISGPNLEELKDEVRDLYITLCQLFSESHPDLVRCGLRISERN